MNIIPNNLILLQKGSQSQIYLSKAKDASASLILKTVDVCHIKQANHLFNQFKLLTEINHQNIIKPISLKKNCRFSDTNKHVIILHYAKHRNLLNFMMNYNRLSVPEIRFIFKQICSAVSYLNSLNIIHRDLKLQNILVFQDSMKNISIRLSDFGFSDNCYDEQVRQFKKYTSFKGTKRGYLAPQIHTIISTKKPYDARKSDIFSLGVILFALLFKRLPFEYALQQNTIYKLIAEQNFEEFWRYHYKQVIKRSNQESFMEQELKDLLCCLLNHIPQKRNNIKQVLEHEWLKGESKQIIIKGN